MALSVSVTHALPLITDGEIYPTLQPNDMLGEGVERVAREACRVQETSEETTKIITSEETAYSFFFKPLPGFRRLVFNMMVDNDLNLADPYEYKKKSVVVNGWEMGHDSINEDGWMPVKVEYYQHSLSFSPDRLGLRVAIGANSSIVRRMYTRNRFVYFKSFFLL